MVNYTLNPSLKQIALVRIAVTLWSQDDAKVLASEFYATSPIDSRSPEWKRIQNVMVENALRLPLPNLLKTELSTVVDAIGCQILIWKGCHNTLNGVRFASKRSNLCWTPQGTVDKRKTAEIFVEDKSIDVYERFKLACTYCLEDYIRILWKELKRVYRINLQNIRRNDPPLVSYWSHFITGKISRLKGVMREFCEDYNISHCEYAFECSAVDGNEVAVRYFFQKLNPEQKMRALMKTAKNVLIRLNEFGNLDFPMEYYGDVVCFLLSQMNEDQQIEVLKTSPCEVLQCFLDWPSQDFFIPTAQRIWSFLPEVDSYVFLRYIIFYKIKPGVRDYNYHKLLGMLWEHLPTSHKKYAIEKFPADDSLILDLFKIGDKENIRLIFNDVTHKEREKIIYSHKGQNICKSLYHSGQLDLLVFFIQECLLSLDDRAQFLEHLKHID